MPTGTDQKKPKEEQKKSNTNSSASGSTNPPSSDFTPKRCRSERPAKKTLTQVLYAAHMKLLQSRHRLSPAKLAEKH